MPPVLTTPPASCVRQNYHPHCEAAINNQISLELRASYPGPAHVYAYFTREAQQSSKEKEH